MIEDSSTDRGDSARSRFAPAPVRHARWGFIELGAGFVVVVLLFLVLSTAIILPVQELSGGDDDSPEVLAAQAVTVIAWDLGMVLTVYAIARRRGGSWRNLGFVMPPVKAPDESRWRSLLAVVVGCYLASITLVFAYGIAVDVSGIEELQPGEQITNAFFDQDVLTALIGIAVVAAAPVSEEVFFRGFIFAGLRRRLPFIVAALISGALFSLAHADIGLMLPFTLVGAMLAYAYERAGTLLASIGVHFLFNAVSFTLLLLVPEAR
jgi:membrane protease YdiL (CAAX protease family)